MSLKSSSTRYGSMAIAIHWTSALAVILALAAGIAMVRVGVSPGLLTAHIVLGNLVFVLTLLRIVWWWVGDKRPPLPANQPNWQRMAAHAVHAALYVILLLMAASGIATIILSGAVPALMSGAPLPDFEGLLPRMTHGIMARILLVLLAAHIGAALFHQFVKRDNLLARMGIGRA
jgi:cytochrome b561